MSHALSKSLDVTTKREVDRRSASLDPSERSGPVCITKREDPLHYVYHEPNSHFSNTSRIRGGARLTLGGVGLYLQ